MTDDLFNQSGTSTHTTGVSGLERLKLVANTNMQQGMGGAFANQPMTPADIMLFWKTHGFTPPTPEQPKQEAQISIDPGSSGAICLFKPSGEVVADKMPDTPKDLLELLRSHSTAYTITCYLEKVQGLPKMGGSPMFNFGQGYGHIEMALLALNIRTVTTRPQEWQKVFGIGTKGKSSTTEWKNKLKAKAQQLFPEQRVTLWNADALLIGEWARNLRNK